jgi:hypothetical protein
MAQHVAGYVDRGVTALSFLGTPGRQPRAGPRPTSASTSWWSRCWNGYQALDDVDALATTDEGRGVAGYYDLRSAASGLLTSS